MYSIPHTDQQSQPSTRVPIAVPDRTNFISQTNDFKKLTPVTRTLLDYRLRIRGIAAAANMQGWWPGAWPVRKDDVIDHYDTGWYSPVYGADGQPLVNLTQGKKIFSWKNSSSDEYPHDRWSHYVPRMKPLMLPRSSILASVIRGDGRLNICEGKADFLSMLSAGITNVAGVFGATFVPDDIANQLGAWNVRYVRVYFHPDRPGADLAQRICDHLDGKIEVHYFALPREQGRKRDLNNLWLATDCNCAAFRQRITKLTEYRFTPRPIIRWEAQVVPPCTLPKGRVQAYGLGVLNRVTKELSAVVAGRNDALNRAAFTLGQYVEAGALEYDAVEADLLAIGVGLGLGQNETAATVRSGLSAGQRNPADLTKLDEEKKGRPWSVQKVKVTSEKKQAQIERAAAHAPVHRPTKNSLGGRSDIWTDENEAVEAYMASFYVTPRKARGEP